MEISEKTAWLSILTNTLLVAIKATPAAIKPELVGPLPPVTEA